MSESAAKTPLKAGQPHVAYVLLWYPLFTQPFIFREVEELRKIMPLRTYTLYGKNLRHCSREMQEKGGHAKTHGVRALFPMLGAVCREACKNPRRLWRLFRRSIWRPWSSMEIFGENLWAFCIGVMLGRQFREDGIDFVYAPWPRGAATAAWVGASLAGLPFALSARGDNLEPADPDLGEKFQAAAFIRANNAADQARIEDFDKAQAKGKTVLLYNSLTLPPAGPPERRPRGENDCLRILAVGRFDVTKGFDVLLRACAILKERQVNFRLTLVGGGGKVMGLGGLEEELCGLRKELALESCVDMPGLVSHDELPGILRAHDLFAAPCVVHATGRRDGIPNTVIEAMAYGLPVVSSRINALPEIVKDGQTGLLVPPADPLALADAIIRLERNPREAEKMGENGAALAREMFDPKINAKNFAAIFQDWRADRRSKQCAE